MKLNSTCRINFILHVEFNIVIVFLLIVTNYILSKFSVNLILALDLVNLILLNKINQVFKLD